MAYGRTQEYSYLRIILLAEGSTEKAFVPHLRRFLDGRGAKLPKIETRCFDGAIPKDLKRRVDTYLGQADAVVTLVDVYTGQAKFKDAAGTIDHLRGVVGRESRFHPHAAQHEFEAWLLPFWDRILQRSGGRGKGFANPESVNHAKPPSQVLRELYRKGNRLEFIKTVEVDKILEGQDLTIAAKDCPQLKAFLNTFLKLSGADTLP